MKCKQLRLGFEFRSSCSFPTTITVTTRALPFNSGIGDSKTLYIYIYIYIYISVCASVTESRPNRKYVFGESGGVESAWMLNGPQLLRQTMWGWPSRSFLVTEGYQIAKYIISSQRKWGFNMKFKQFWHHI